MKRSRSRNNVDVAASTCVIPFPLHSSRTAQKEARHANDSSPKELPSPHCRQRGMPNPVPAEGETARGWLTNSTIGSFWRDESTAERDETLDRARSGADSSKINLLCGAA